MTLKTIVNETEQLQLASRLIKLGATLQLLESLTLLPRKRIITLYKESQGWIPHDLVEH